MKRASGGIARKVNGQHDSYTQRYRKHGQAQPDRLAEERPEHQPVKES
jgi:hypothetical protein